MILLTTIHLLVRYKFCCQISKNLDLVNYAGTKKKKHIYPGSERSRQRKDLQIRARNIWQYTLHKHAWNKKIFAGPKKKRRVL